MIRLTAATVLEWRLSLKKKRERESTRGAKSGVQSPVTLALAAARPEGRGKRRWAGWPGAACPGAGHGPSPPSVGRRVEEVRPLRRTARNAYWTEIFLLGPLEYG